MNKNSSIFLAGHKGLVGSEVLNILKKKKYKNIITLDKKKVDLRDHKKLNSFFKKKKIDYMIMAAARAGGILANTTYQKDFFFENIEIQNNLLKLAVEKKIKRTIFLGSSCIYPKFSKNPIVEESLLTGILEKTNQCYAIAKIAGIKLSEAIYKQDGLDIICLMPTNVFGKNDNFNKFTGHVIPAMIQKFYEAKKNNKKEIKLLGSGKPIREFLHSVDLAGAIMHILKVPKKNINKIFKSELPILNVGSANRVTIKKLALIISKAFNYKGKVIFDKNFPDGTYKKNLNSSKIKKLGWKSKIKLQDGIKSVIKNFPR
jgi:GDP-L-fucose synthase